MANQPAAEEERANANSELRILTLELMKLAQKKKISFERMSQEFVQNVYTLDDMLAESIDSMPAQKTSRAFSKEKL